MTIRSWQGAAGWGLSVTVLLVAMMTTVAVGQTSEGTAIDPLVDEILSGV